MRRVVAVIAALLMVVAACGDDGSGATTSSTSTTATTAASPSDTEAPAGSTTTTASDDVEVEPLPDLDDAEPIDVSATTDPTAAGATEVGPEGGTVEAVAGDGTTYTLTIPPGALITPEEITMTPVTAIEGLPADVPVGGVLLEPEGLVFLKSAALRIDLPQGTATEDLFAAATFAGGADLHLTSKALQGSTLTLDIPHFTLRLHGTGLAGVRSAMTNRTPGSHEAWVREREAEFSEAFLEDDPDPEGYGFTVLAPLRRWRATIAIRLDAAANLADDARFDDAIAEYTVWESVVAGAEAKAEGHHAGAFQALYDTAHANLDRALTTAAGVAFARCVDGDIDQAARLHRFAAIASRFGLSNAGEFVDKAQRCATFEFRADSTFTGRQPDVGLELLTGVTFSTRLQPTTEEYDGVEVPVGFRQFSINAAEASQQCSTKTRDGIVQVRLDLDLNIRSPQPQVEQMVVHIVFPEIPTEVFKCGNAEQPFSIWHELFTKVHGLEGGFLPMQLVDEGEVVAADRFEGTVKGPGPTEYTGTSDIEIIHAPE